MSHHILRYHCDCCDFTTEHEVGLKIHKSKTHKYKCGNCNVYFKNEEQLVRHESAEVMLANLNKTCSEEYGLHVKQHLIDEKCLGVYNTNHPRDDKLPDLFLHSSECWDGSNHPCLDLPDTSEHDNGVFIDHSFYHPIIDETMHGDSSLPRCDMDWITTKKVLEENV